MIFKLVFSQLFNPSIDRRECLPAIAFILWLPPTVSVSVECTFDLHMYHIVQYTLYTSIAELRPASSHSCSYGAGSSFTAPTKAIRTTLIPTWSMWEVCVCVWSQSITVKQHSLFLSKRQQQTNLFSIDEIVSGDRLHPPICVIQILYVLLFRLSQIEILNQFHLFINRELCNTESVFNPENQISIRLNFKPDCFVPFLAHSTLQTL